LRRFIIREADRFDFDEIKKFLRDNSDDHIRQRADEDLKKAISDGIFLLAIETNKNPNNKYIFGVSTVFSIEVLDDSNKSVILKEAGSSLITEEYRGFGIHKIFHSIRILHEYITDKGGFTEYFCSIRVPNERSVENALKSGFQKWEDAPQFLQLDRNSSLRADQKIEFYRFNPDENIAKHAESILFHDEWHTMERADKITGAVECVEIHLSVELNKKYRPLLQAIVKGLKIH
jgi:hypothetical protein